MKLQLIILSALLINCQTIDRKFKYKLGKKPSLTQRAAANVFESRQGLFVTIPDRLLNMISGELKAEIHEKKFATKNKKIKRTQSKAGTLEYQVGNQNAKICVDELQISSTSTQPAKLSLKLVTCGLEVIAENAWASFELSEPLSASTMRLSMRSLRLKKSKVSSPVIVEMLPIFDRNGKLLVEDIEVTSGIKELADINNYDVRISESGFEKNSGIIGDRVHEIRTMMIKSILKGLETFIVGTIKSSAAKNAAKIINRINKRRIAEGGLNFKAKTHKVHLTGAIQLTGLIGGKDGLGIAAHLTSSAVNVSKDNSYKCTATHTKAPDPSLRNLSFFHNFYEFPADLGKNISKQNGLTTIDVGVYLPKQFLDYLIWQPLGNAGQCVFPVILPNGARGTLTLVYNEPVKIDIEDPDSRFKGAKGAMLTTRYPASKLILSKTITNVIRQSRLKIGKITSKGTTEINFDDFRHSVLFKVNKGNQTIIPHPKLQTLYEERYEGAIGIHIDRTLDFIADTVPGFAEPANARESTHAFLQSIVDQLFKLTMRDGILVWENNENKIRSYIDQISVENNTILAKIRVMTTENFIDFKKTSLELNSNSSRDLTALGIPNIIGAHPSQVEDHMKNAAFLPNGFRCRLKSIKGGIPTFEDKLTFINYATCEFENVELVEYRWQFQNNEEASAVNYVRMKILNPTKPGTRLNLQLRDFIKKLNRPVDVRSSDRTLVASWSVNSSTLLFNGICPEPNSSCKKSKNNALLSELEVWRD